MIGVRRAVAFIIEHQVSFGLGFLLGGLYCSVATVGGQAFLQLLRAVSA